MGANPHGIPKPYIKNCCSCDYGKRRLPRPIQVNVIACTFQQYNKRHTMPLAKKDCFINEVKTTHAIRVSPIGDYNRMRPYLVYVLIYACHWGKEFQRKTMYHDDSNDGIRHCLIAKYVG
jgi:hypothetical protein